MRVRSPIVDRYSTELRYTKSDVSKAIEELKKYASTSEIMRHSDMWDTEFTGNIDWDQHIYLHLPLERRLNRQLDEIYGEYFEEESDDPIDYIEFVWVNFDLPEGDYKLGIGGRELCPEFYDFHKNPRNCSCLEGFAQTCKDIRRILKKHSVTGTEKS